MRVLFSQKHLYIYIIVLVIFSAFYLSLFYINRVGYLRVNLKNNELRIMQNVIINTKFVNFLNTYHLNNFVKYSEIVKVLYASNDKNLPLIIKKDYNYDFVGIVTLDNRYKVSNDDNFFNVIDLREITDLNATSVFIRYFPDRRITYKIFVTPLLINGVLDSFFVVYLNINELLDYNNLFLVSKRGIIVNNYAVDYIDYGENIFFVFPDEWNSMANADSGQILSSNGIFTYSTLYDLIKVGGTNIIQDKYYLLSFYPIDEEDNPYFIKNFSTLVKYIDFKTNIIYWIVGYFWIIGASVLVYIIILGRIEQGKFASFDYMTGALNRRGGDKRVNVIVNEYSAKGLKRVIKWIIASVIYFRKPVYSIHIAMVDVNSLKQVNDNLGHKYGDELIVYVAHSLRCYLSSSELLVRMGGDEFMIVFINRKEASINSYWNSVNNLFNKHNNLSNKVYSVNISYGVVKYESSMTLEEAIKLADELMYKYKKRHKVNLFFI